MLRPISESEHVNLSFFDTVTYRDDNKQLLCTIMNIVEQFFFLGFLEGSRTFEVSRRLDSDGFLMNKELRNYDKVTLIDLSRILCIGFFLANYITLLPIVGLFIGSRIYRAQVISLDGNGS